MAGYPLDVLLRSRQLAGDEFVVWLIYVVGAGLILTGAMFFVDRFRASVHRRIEYELESTERKTKDEQQAVRRQLRKYAEDLRDCSLRQTHMDQFSKEEKAERSKRALRIRDEAADYLEEHFGEEVKRAFLRSPTSELYEPDNPERVDCADDFADFLHHAANTASWD